MKETQFIVLTGGPGAGKTAILEFMRKTLCPHVAVLPEAASILFSGGFWRLDSNSAKIAAQKSIFHVQSEMQNLIAGEDQWSLGLCDRGTLDGVAYWPGSEENFFATLNTTVAKEYAKYLAVIHLATPEIKNGYNHENPIRVESAEEAAVIDQRIRQVWSKHQNYYRIESKTNFLDKVQQASMLIHSLLPSECQIHGKAPIDQG